MPAKTAQLIAPATKPAHLLSTLLLGALIAATALTSADARLSTKNFTCSDVKDLVFQQGAIVLNTKSSSVFRRFVADRSFCQRDQIARRISVPSKSERCRLLHCAPREESMSN